MIDNGKQAADDAAAKELDGVPAEMIDERPEAAASAIMDFCRRVEAGASADGTG